MDEAVMAFDRTIDALRAEAALTDAALTPRVMPLPAAIRAGCGICLRVACSDAAAAQDIVTRAGIVPAGWYLRRVPSGALETLSEGIT